MQKLPDFRNPPVIETVLGVRFAPIPKLTVPFFGLYWQTLGKQFSDVQVQPPLANQLDQSEGFGFEFSPPGHVRCWYVDDQNGRLIQLQSDRFLYNWRKGHGSANSYPRYDDAIRSEFLSEWQGFLAFTGKNELGAPEVNQCEVTYINHIPSGEGWDDLSALPDVVTFCRNPNAADAPFLNTPRHISYEAAYAIPGKSVQLRVQLKQATRVADGQKLLALNLTAIGKPSNMETDAIMDCLDECRDAVVRSFGDLTAKQVQEIWGRT